jgi:hypothetical protein
VVVGNRRNLEGDEIMAKGQKRSTREKKKPKKSAQAKQPVGAASSYSSMAGVTSKGLKRTP